MPPQAPAADTSHGYQGQLQRALRAYNKQPSHPHDSTKAAAVCALEDRPACCDGKGYHLYAQGPFIRAKLCECVLACARCGGSSYKEDPQHARMKPCSQILPQRTVALYNESSLPVRFFDSTLEDFRNFTGNGEWVVAQLEKLLKRFPQHQRGVILSGPVGVGKTYLLVSMAKRLLKQGYRVRFIDFFQLITQIKSGYSQRMSEEELIRPLIEVDVLLIDELGKGRNSEFEHTILDQLVMGRYNQNKPLISSTNFPFSHRPTETVPMFQDAHKGFSLDYFVPLSKRVGPRIFSRLQESCEFLELEGQDYRSIQSSLHSSSFSASASAPPPQRRP